MRQGSVADGASSFRGLETHRFPRAVPIKRCELRRLCLKGQLSPGSGEGQSSGTIEHWTLMIQRTETERASNQRQGMPGHWPMTSVRAHGRNAVGVVVGSLPARPTRLQLDVGLARSVPSSLHELLHVEDGATLEHVVDRAPDLVSEDREGLGLAMLSLEFLE